MSLLKYWLNEQHSVGFSGFCRNSALKQFPRGKFAHKWDLMSCHNGPHLCVQKLLYLGIWKFSTRWRWLRSSFTPEIMWLVRRNVDAKWKRSNRCSRNGVCSPVRDVDWPEATWATKVKFSPNWPWCSCMMYFRNGNDVMRCYFRSATNSNTNTRWGKNSPLSSNFLPFSQQLRELITWNFIC